VVNLKHILFYTKILYWNIFIFYRSVEDMNIILKYEGVESMEDDLSIINFKNNKVYNTPQLGSAEIDYEERWYIIGAFYLYSIL